MAHILTLVNLTSDQIDSESVTENYVLTADGEGQSIWQNPLDLISIHTVSTDLHLMEEDRQYLNMTRGIDAGTASTIWGDETILDGGGA